MDTAAWEMTTQLFAKKTAGLYFDGHQDTVYCDLQGSLCHFFPPMKAKDGPGSVSMYDKLGEPNAHFIQGLFTAISFWKNMPYSM